MCVPAEEGESFTESHDWGVGRERAREHGSPTQASSLLLFPACDSGAKREEGEEVPYLLSISPQRGHAYTMDDSPLTLSPTICLSNLFYCTLKTLSMLCRRTIISTSWHLETRLLGYCYLR